MQRPVLRRVIYDPFPFSQEYLSTPSPAISTVLTEKTDCSCRTDHADSLLGRTNPSNTASVPKNGLSFHLETPSKLMLRLIQCGNQ
jgi:hypothetical protein